MDDPTLISSTVHALLRPVLLVLHRAVPQPEVHVVHVLHHLWNVHHKVDKTLFSDYIIIIMAIDEDDDHERSSKCRATKYAENT